MSDSKWMKFFRILFINRDILKNCLIKDVYGGRFYKINIPLIQEFSHSFYDKGIRDVLTGARLHLKKIYWIEFPAEWEMRTKILEPQKLKQNVFKIETLFE